MVGEVIWIKLQTNIGTIYTMTLFTGSIFLDLLAVTVAVFATIYTYCHWTYQIWKRKGVPYFEPKIPFGNLPKVQIISIGDDVANTAHAAKRKGWKYFGFFFGLKPVFIPLDLDIVKSILIKDFNYFSDRGEYMNERDDPVSANLFTMGGEKWKTLRTKLTPNFTSGKIKAMFQNFLDCSSALEDNLKQFGSTDTINIHEVVSCFMVDIIGSCAFGVQCNSFKDPDKTFLKYGKKFVNRSKLEELKNVIMISFPNLSKFLRLKLIPTDISNFFYSIVSQTINHRKKNNIVRNDFLQLLINMMESDNNVKKVKDIDDTTVTLDEIVAQCFIFFLGGFETTSVTMTFSLYELAEHPEIQEKVREELFRVLEKYNNQLTHDSLKELKYMQQVVDEILRKYPPLPLVFRGCVQDYRIPDTDLILKKGSTVLIPIKYIHYDKDYYENPDKFDPERFSSENKNKIHQAAYLPFGEGPRICPGQRFGLTQVKVGLATILKNYRIKLDQKMPTPLELDPKSLATSPKGGMWVNLEKIEK